MSAGFAALRDDDLRPGVHSPARLVEVLHLSDERDAGRVDAIGEWP